MKKMILLFALAFCTNLHSQSFNHKKRNLPYVPSYKKHIMGFGYFVINGYTKEEFYNEDVLGIGMMGTWRINRTRSEFWSLFTSVYYRRIKEENFYYSGPSVFFTTHEIRLEAGPVFSTESFSFERKRKIGIGIEASLNIFDMFDKKIPSPKLAPWVHFWSQDRTWRIRGFTKIEPWSPGIFKPGLDFTFFFL